MDVPARRSLLSACTPTAPRYFSLGSSTDHSATARLAAFRHYSGHVMCTVCSYRGLYCQFLQRTILPVLTEVYTASSYRGLYCQFLLRSTRQFVITSSDMRTAHSFVKTNFRAICALCGSFMYLFLVFCTFFDSKWHLILTLTPRRHEDSIGRQTRKIETVHARTQMSKDALTRNAQCTVHS